MNFRKFSTSQLPKPVVSSKGPFRSLKNLLTFFLWKATLRAARPLRGSVSCGSGWSVPCVSIQLTLSQSPVSETLTLSVETASRRFKFTRQARAAPVGKTDIRGCLPSGLACLLVLSRDTSEWVPTTALALGLRWIVLQQRCSFKRRRGGGNERRADRRLRRHAGDHAARDVACSSASHTTPPQMRLWPRLDA